MGDKRRGVRLVVDGIHFKVKDKVILDDVSMSVKSGELFAIIGQTGSGKTTFLNMISGRQSPDRGTITLNGEMFDKRLRRTMAFVQQHDVFFSQLTLMETLQFTASLRIPEHVPKAKKFQLIKVIVKSLHLEKCLNTVIGDIFTKGLSGGEKKRASIACELLTNPDLILLDEPTSGLDSTTAQNIMEFLRRYAIEHNKLVIFSIHQPSSKIYHMFHRLLILSDGKAVYNGRRKLTIPYFTELGAHFEQHYNPCDYIMEFVTEGDDERNEAIRLKALAQMQYNRESTKMKSGNSHMKQTTFQLESETYMTDSDTDSLIEETRIHLLQENNAKQSSTTLQFTPPERSEDKWPTSWWTQYKVLSCRSLKQSIRIIKQGYSLVQAISVAVLCSLIYFQVGVSLTTARDVFGLLFFYVGYWSFIPSMTVISSYGEEHHVVVKERSSGAYRLSAYALARLTSELPDTFIHPGIMLTMFWWLGGFGGVAEFFLSMVIMYLQVSACFALGLLISVLCRDLRMAVTTLFCYMISMYLLGGFFSQNVPFWMEWIKYCSIFYYPYAFTISMVASNIPNIPCNITVAESFPVCVENVTSSVTSSDVLEQANVHLPEYILAIIVVCYSVLIRIVTYIAMRLKHEKIV